MQKFISVICLAVLLTFLCSLPAGSQQYSSSGAKEINRIIKGAVEDISWIRAPDRQKLHKIFNQYFTGQLLEDLTEQTWRFKCLNTDWYTTTQLEKITIKSIDENRSIVLAYIKETNLINGTTSKATGKFILIKTPAGWRIKQMVILEK